LCDILIDMRILWPLVRSMSSDAVKMLVQAFISCCLDYCNSVFFTLQHITWTDDPAAVCPECGCTSHVRCSTIWPHHAIATPAVLASSSEAGGLHPGHHSLSGMALAYLVADCHLSSKEGRHRLHSADSRTCVVRWTYSYCGISCFLLLGAGPRLWNSPQGCGTAFQLVLANRHRLRTV